MSFTHSLTCSRFLSFISGSGALGVSNSLGANSLAIMFSLGLPWLIRNMVDGAWNTGANISIHSNGIEFVVLSLILAVCTLYTIVTIGKYILRKTIGVILVFAYLIFVSFAILVEMDVFFPTTDC
jgi:Ca2+/Na+ antiporter